MSEAEVLRLINEWDQLDMAISDASCATPENMSQRFEKMAEARRAFRDYVRSVSRENRTAV